MSQGLEETIKIYKEAFGQKWQEAFFATVKVGLNFQHEESLQKVEQTSFYEGEK